MRTLPQASTAAIETTVSCTASENSPEKKAPMEGRGQKGPGWYLKNLQRGRSKTHLMHTDVLIESISAYPFD